MSYYVKVSFLCAIVISLSACDNVSLPNGLSLKHHNQDSQQEIHENDLETTLEENHMETEHAEVEIDPEFLLESEYFNRVQPVDNLNIIENPTNVLAMVNKDYSLPSTYKPEDLVIPNVEFSFGEAEVEKRYLREEAAHALEELFSLAKKDQIELFAVSGYRSYSRQQGIFNSEKEAKGEVEAMQAVALAGQSEHQTGLAMDVTSRSVNLEITEEFGQTEEGMWVEENAHLAGFIVRYPKGKEEITGYQYEPWHLRYVGKEKATTMFEHQLTLEEYFNRVKKI
ncbi:M15 family metallopeptidase [Bacillus weihaiensis]|uniref:Peptidase M15 n=1 Tax=Bacillus weihaiensis TaxID=1547283 RepID=A0A1L3MQU8_9BACI|nr:M15 family metallopeptidase [Bacillus weihaiensis]APH04729.1 peptidase M15 [Bacillus weihaiensis]